MSSGPPKAEMPYSRMLAFCRKIGRRGPSFRQKDFRDLLKSTDEFVVLQEGNMGRTYQRYFMKWSEADSRDTRFTPEKIGQWYWNIGSWFMENEGQWESLQELSGGTEFWIQEDKWRVQKYSSFQALMTKIQTGI